MLVADKTKPFPTSCDAADLSQWPASVADRGGAEAIPDLSGGWFHLHCSAPRLPRCRGAFLCLRGGDAQRRQGAHTRSVHGGTPGVVAGRTGAGGKLAGISGDCLARTVCAAGHAAKINAEVRKMAADPGFQEKVFAPTHFRSLASTPAEFAAMLRSEYAAWKKFADDAKIKTD